MITGTVTSLDEALIRIKVRGGTGAEVSTEAVIDTGFNGSLTLRPQDAKAVFVQTHSIRPYTMANGMVENLPECIVDLEWDGRWMPVIAAIVDGDPLVGMKVLRGYRLTMDVVDNGRLVIEDLP
jgi:predicted aspartyl protease